MATEKFAEVYNDLYDIKSQYEEKLEELRIIIEGMAVPGKKSTISSEQPKRKPRQSKQTNTQENKDDKVKKPRGRPSKKQAAKMSDEEVETIEKVNINEQVKINKESDIESFNSSSESENELGNETDDSF